MTQAAVVPTNLVQESERISYDDKSVFPARAQESARSTYGDKSDAFASIARLADLIVAATGCWGECPPQTAAFVLPEEVLSSPFQHGPYYYSAARVLDDEPSLEQTASDLASRLGNRRRRQTEHEAELNALALCGVDAIQPITAFLEECGTDEVIRDAGAVLADIACTPDAFVRVASLLRNQDTSVQVAAARALASAEGAGAGERARLLGSATVSPSAEVREAAISALTQIGGPDALAVLRGAFDVERDATLRESIEQAIAEIEHTND